MLIDFKSLEGSKLVKPTHKKKKSVKNISANTSEELTSKDVVSSLNLRYISHKYIINNAYIFDWESDFFSVTESDYVYEVEVKVTRGDFKDDFNKVAKHLLLEGVDRDGFLKKPNKFFYAAPKGLLSTSMIPAYAGLIEVTSANEMAVVVKEAPFLHKEKTFLHLKDILFDKFYNRYRDYYLND
jgi:hypothetical protein